MIQGSSSQNILNLPLRHIVQLIAASHLAAFRATFSFLLRFGLSHFLFPTGVLTTPLYLISSSMPSTCPVDLSLLVCSSKCVPWISTKITQKPVWFKMCQTYFNPLNVGASNRVSVVWLFAFKAFILIYIYSYYNNFIHPYIPHASLWHIYVCILHRQWTRWQGTTVRMASLRVTSSTRKEQEQKCDVNNIQSVTVKWWVISNWLWFKNSNWEIPLVRQLCAFACQRGSIFSIREQFLWKLATNRILGQHIGCPLSVSFQQCSIFIHSFIHSFIHLSAMLYHLSR